MRLLKEPKPCHQTIAYFRCDNAEALQAVHRDSVQLCRGLLCTVISWWLSMVRFSAAMPVARGVTRAISSTGVYSASRRTGREAPARLRRFRIFGSRDAEPVTGNGAIPAATPPLPRADARRRAAKPARQRCPIGVYSRGAGPLYSASGRMRMLLSTCSSIWAVQPGTRPIANSGTNRSRGMACKW